MKALTKVCALLVSLSPIVAHADVNLVPKSHIGWLGIQYQSNVAADYGVDNNVTYLRADPISSSYREIKPTVTATGSHLGDQYLLMYQGDYRRYQADKADNNNNSRFFFHGNWWFKRRNNLDLQSSRTYGDEARGQGSSLGFTPEQFSKFGINHPLPTIFDDTTLRYNYGAPDAEGKLSVAFEHKNFDYQNLGPLYAKNNNFGLYMTDQNWQQNSFVGELFDQVSKETRFRYTFIANLRRYKTPFASQKDSNEYYLWYGIKSKRSGKTTVNANVSWLYKEFIRDPQRATFSGLNWDLTWTWKPVNYSTVQLLAHRYVQDPDTTGGYVLDTVFGGSWVYHWWRNRLYSEVNYSIEYKDHKHQSVARKDKLHVFSASLNYQFRPSIGFAFTYMHQNMRSNLDKDYFAIGHSDAICSPSDHNNAMCVSRTLGYNRSMIWFTTKVQI